MKSVLVGLVAVAFLVSMSATAADERSQVTVFAAASLSEVLKEVSDAYAKSGGAKARLSFAASSALARQIESGAKADVFFSADSEWVDYLQLRNLVDRSSRQDVLMNRLVLIANADNQIDLKIAPNFSLAAAIGNSRLATADPDSVPVGRYARSALATLGVWNQIADRVVRTDNVRVALAYVARGEAVLGIVYRTDALIEKKVRIVDTFPANTHPPIVYPIVLTRTASPAAKAYVAYVAGPQAATIFKKYGFARN